jgi:hypothetical protein
MSNIPQKFIHLLLSILCGTLLLVTPAHSDICPEYRKQLEANPTLDRRVEGYYDMQYNSISAIQFVVHNDGRTFYDAKLGRLTGI